MYHTNYPDHLQPLNHPFYDFLSPKQQEEWRIASDKVLGAINNGLNHPTGVILPAYSTYNLGRSINILCTDYLGTNSDKLSSTFWDFIDNEYTTLCQRVQQANQDPHEAPFPLTRMPCVLDRLALPPNKSWRLQQKGILLAVIGHQYALHKIRQLNDVIQTNLTTIQAVLLTDFQA